MDSIEKTYAKEIVADNPEFIYARLDDALQDEVVTYGMMLGRKFIPFNQIDTQRYLHDHVQPNLHKFINVPDFPFIPDQITPSKSRQD
tara:strand:- start:4929 stop:5192 length:264 start_codon:yes stop_codon:yes gene_type:complete